MSKAKQGDVTLDRDLEDALAAALKEEDKAVRSELFLWSQGQLKLRGRQLVAAKRRAARVGAKAIALSGRKALQLHRDHAEKVVTKLEGFINKMEKINAAVKP